MAGTRRPESVLVVVYVDPTQVLLLRRIEPFGFWQSVTGSLDAGESARAAARRELLEETGLSDQGELDGPVATRTFIIDPRWRNRFEPGVTKNVEYEFRFRLPLAVDIRIDRKEHAGYQWATIDAAMDKVWSWTNKQALERLRDEL